MQTFNFFVVATAFLIAAYGSLLKEHADAAGTLAALGAWLTFLFNWLDVRNRQLVEAGERALKVSQRHLADVTQNPDMRILDGVERPGSYGLSHWGRLLDWLRRPSYGRVINLIQWTVIGLFLLAAAYAWGWMGHWSDATGRDFRI